MDLTSEVRQKPHLFTVFVSCLVMCFNWCKRRVFQQTREYGGSKHFCTVCHYEIFTTERYCSQI